MAFIEDFHEFLDTDDFAVTATVNGLSVRGIFDAEYQDVFNVESSSPAFSCVADDVSTVSNGDLITINSVVYTIVEQQPDGTGMTVLRLHK